MPIARRFIPAACAALSLLLAACGGGSGAAATPTSPTSPPAVTAPPPPVATTTGAYSGLFANGMFTGTVTLSADVPVSATPTDTSTAGPQVTANAAGTAKFSGATQSTVNLAGSYDTASNRFTLSGGSFSVDAVVSEEMVTGTIKTPAGEGGIAALRSTELSPVTRFCGTYRGSESGKLLVVIRGSTASGVGAQDGDPDPITLKGSASGNTVRLTWSWVDGGGGRGEANGTINGTILSGTWGNTDGQIGTWSGSSAGC
jgi:hypothetical protein